MNSLHVSLQRVDIECIDVMRLRSRILVCRQRPVWHMQDTSAHMNTSTKDCIHTEDYEIQELLVR